MMIPIKIKNFRNKEAAEQLQKAGIKVVEACTLVLLRTNQY
jgi:hypothetical protein